MPVADRGDDRSPSPNANEYPLLGATGGGDGTDLTVNVSVEEQGWRYRDEIRMQPDDPEHVAHQTESIFSQFMWERYSNDLDNQQLPENTPSFPDLSTRVPQPFSVEAQIGRQLATIGDDIDRRYAPQISEMIKHLNVDKNNAYETFSRVAESLFRDNQINWGRVIALFLFGYRIAIEKIQRGIHDFVSKIIRWIGTFVKDRICSWIAQQGGWRAVVLRLGPESVSSTNLGLLFVSAGFFALAAYFLTIRRN